MKIFRGFDDIHPIRNAVVTTGSFDGVHAGHKAILERLTNLATEIHGETVVITFDPHPRKVLNPGTGGDDLRLIHSQQEKIRVLRTTGLGNLIIAAFTLPFSRITPEEFVETYLIGKLHVKKIVIGFNHHFGHNREGDTDRMHRLGRKFGFGVEEIPEQDILNEKVSSSKIRHALLSGDIVKANAYLGYPYFIMGMVSTGHPPDGIEGFQSFTIKVEEEMKLIPPDGVYTVRIGDGKSSRGGLCLVRNRGRSAAAARIDCFLPSGSSPLVCRTIILHFFKSIPECGPYPVTRELSKVLKENLL